MRYLNFILMVSLLSSNLMAIGLEDGYESVRLKRGDTIMQLLAERGVSKQRLSKVLALNKLTRQEAQKLAVGSEVWLPKSQNQQSLSDSTNYTKKQTAGTNTVLGAATNTEPSYSDMQNKSDEMFFKSSAVMREDVKEESVSNNNDKNNMLKVGAFHQNVRNPTDSNDIFINTRVSYTYMKNFEDSSSMFTKFALTGYGMFYNDADTTSQGELQLEPGYGLNAALDYSVNGIFTIAPKVSIEERSNIVGSGNFVGERRDRIALAGLDLKKKIALGESQFNIVAGAERVVANTNEELPFQLDNLVSTNYRAALNFFVQKDLALSAYGIAEDYSDNAGLDNNYITGVDIGVLF